MCKMEYRSFRVKSPVKSFRDLEVYQATIQLSDEITNLPFLNKEQFEQDNNEIKNNNFPIKQRKRQSIAADVSGLKLSQ